MRLNLNDTFNKQLPADSDTSNTRRQVFGACFSYVTPRVPSHPKLLHVTAEVAELIGLSKEDVDSAEFLDIVSGGKVYPETQPYAMAYAGHQFGNWAGQLGDGRAINLFEVLHKEQRWALQLKGAGETPYSRTADGLAVLRSSIREHLCSEAMFHLGVPTTRSLSLVSTGDKVLRDILYNGNPAYEDGAVVCRVAPSFIRFGNFELLAARKDLPNLKALADYTINYFYPEIALSKIEYAFYQPDAIVATLKTTWLNWMELYLQKLNEEPISDADRKAKMNKVNPKYVLRNYMAQLAIDAAEKEDYTLIEELYELLKQPYDEQPQKEKWFSKRPDWARNKVGCSMLSCSS